MPISLPSKKPQPHDKQKNPPTSPDIAIWWYKVTGKWATIDIQVENLWQEEDEVREDNQSGYI